MVSISKILHIMKKTDPRDRESWQWVRDADLTYCAARFLLLKGDVFFRREGGWLLHLSVEKYLKAARHYLRHQLPYKKGGHKLLAIWRDIDSKGRHPNRQKLEDAINKIEKLFTWRYMENSTADDRKTMEEGLCAADFLVSEIRALIPEEITHQGLPRVVNFNVGKHSFLLVKCIVRNNKQADYWLQELQVVEYRLYRYAKKVNTFKTF